MEEMLRPDFTIRHPKTGVKTPLFLQFNPAASILQRNMLYYFCTDTKGA